MIKTIITSAAIATIGLIGMEAGWAAPSSAQMRMTEAQRAAICASGNASGFALLGMVNCSNSELNRSRARMESLNIRCQAAGYTQWSESHGKCVSY